MKSFLANFSFNCGAALFAALALSSCISAEKAQELDRSYVNQPQADLKMDLNSITSPYSGLRSSSAGASSCSLCAK